MTALANLSIKRKLTIVTMATALSALSVASTIFGAYDVTKPIHRDDLFGEIDRLLAIST